MDKPLFPQVLARLSEMTEQVTNKVVERIGPIGEPVSTKKQMEAYLQLTNEDIVSLTARHGEDKMRNYLREMESRKGRMKSG